VKHKATKRTEVSNKVRWSVCQKDEPKRWTNENRREKMWSL